jgi:hypothetical protein
MVMATLTLYADKAKAAPNETVLFTVVYDSDIPSYLSSIELFFGDGGSFRWVIELPTQHYEVYIGHEYESDGYYEAKAIAIYADRNNPGGTYVWSNPVFILVFVEAPTPPPPVLPPPPTPIPIEPPEGPPIERPLEPKPEEPPFQPPDRPPPTFGPPDRQPPPRLTNDYLTWNAFVAKYGDRIKRWALEVPLDYGDLPPDPNAPPQYKAMWQRLTGHKADAFIDFGHVIYVAEVKPRLTLAALGQAYFGWQLAVKRYRFDKPVKPCVICSTAPHTLLPIAAQNGITVFVLEGITGGQPEE